jgi:hypothetical protein
VGVTDARPTTIDGATLVAALRDHLATVDPNLAAAIPDTAIPDLHLPDVDPPFVSSLRSVAEACTAWLAAIAIVLFALALVIGDRRYALRRYGIWAIVTGLLWAVGPRIVVLLAHRWTPEADATIGAAVGAATKVVTAAATALVASGVVAIVVAQFAGLGQRFVDAPPPSAAPSPRPAPSRVAPASPAYARTPAAPIDTYEPGRAGDSGWYGDAAHAPAHTPTGAAPSTTVMHPPAWGAAASAPAAWGPAAYAAPPPQPAVAHPDPDDVDPWAHFAGPAVRPEPRR